MKYAAILMALFSASCTSASDPALPIADGMYVFHHRFAEQPEMSNIDLDARIEGRHIVLRNTNPSKVFPQGVIADGTLMWHARSRQWIIGERASDRNVADVGGCSDGPEVVDLAAKVYWTC